jgi:hypothetical protein
VERDDEKGREKKEWEEVKGGVWKETEEEVEGRGWKDAGQK